MAKLNTHWFSNKLRHTGENALEYAKKAGKAGIALGLLAGAGVAVLSGAAIIPAVLSYGVIGGIYGLSMGATFGGLKGILTRPEPRASDIMQEAAADCNTVTPEATPQPQPQPQVQMPAPAPVQGEQACGKPPVMTASAAQDELNQLTAALCRMQAEAAAAPQAQCEGAPAGNWQERIGAVQPDAARVR